MEFKVVKIIKLYGKKGDNIMLNLISKDKIVKEESLELKGCNKIIIKFSNHIMDVELIEGDNLKIVQLADDSFKDEEMFIATRNNDVIEIRQEKEKSKIKIRVGRVSRKLKISIPRSYSKCLEIRKGLGSININDSLKLESLNIESSSGNFKCNSKLEGNEVTIKSSFGSINLNELVAKVCNLQSSSGTITVDSINGDLVKIKSNLGNIKLRKLSAIDNKIETSSGEVSIEEINGDNVYLKSSLGNISASKIYAKENKIEASSGSVNIDNLDGEDINIKTRLGSVVLGEIISSSYNIETSSGKIKIDSIDGSGHIIAKLGSININYKDIKEFSTVKATSGNVKLFVPKGLSFEFWAECSSGRIKSNFDINYKTRNGNKATVLVGKEPYKKINVITTMGSVDFNEK